MGDAPFPGRLHLPSGESGAVGVGQLLLAGSGNKGLHSSRWLCTCRRPYLPLMERAQGGLTASDANFLLAERLKSAD